MVYIFLHFKPETIPKIYVFSKKNLGPSVLIKCNQSTDSAFEAQHKLCFLTFHTTNYTSIRFFKHQNQLGPLSTLSHTGGADLSRSRFVCFEKMLFQIHIGAYFYQPLHQFER